jgi:hypothetical protein
MYDVLNSTKVLCCSLVLLCAVHRQVVRRWDRHLLLPICLHTQKYIKTY